MQKILTMEFIKYLIVGGINTLFTGAIFYICLRWLTINYSFALVICSVLGILLTYILNFLWVFKPEDKLRFNARFPKYFLTYGLSISGNLMVLRYTVETFHYDPFYVQIVLIPFVVVFNFILTKFWSLQKNN
jgi:putative flippase GtrA